MAAQMKKMLPAYWADPARIQKYQEHFAATSMSVDALRGADASKWFPFDLIGELKNITAPALIVAGERDFICPPAEARQMHLSLPNSKLLLIEDCGHFPWLEQAEEFNSQVPRFLQASGFGNSSRLSPEVTSLRRCHLSSRLLIGDTWRLEEATR